jgi:hypothetical protein
MLEDPRWLLARAPLPLPEEPENALRSLALGELETCRLPTRSPPPRSAVEVLGALARFDTPGLELPRPPAPPAPRSIVPALGPPPARAWF